MKLEVLYSDGCPSHERLMPILRELAATHDAELVQSRIETAERAEEARFLGSPSVRVDGRDVEPAAQTRTDYGLKCRLYRRPAGQSGLLPREWIQHALRETTAR
ncbi:MAG: thioredoxin family protein [Pseudonocardiales bacterium]|nr:MAG: thioredoxin family protein [Pseudonocardiales bacterium]